MADKRPLNDHPLEYERRNDMTEKTTTIKSRAGYDIPVRYILNGDEEVVVVMAHGFGSGKASPTVTLLMDNLPQSADKSRTQSSDRSRTQSSDKSCTQSSDKSCTQSSDNSRTQKIGVVAFDFPAHGESPVDGTHLRIENCINDLMSAVAFAKAAAPAARIINFGSSFGAYITMLYITRLNTSRDAAGSLAETTVQPYVVKAFLRSAAVNMPELFEEPAPDDAEQLARDGYVIMDYEPRNLKITSEFIADLQANNLFKCFVKGDAQLKMIHGTADEDIDYAKAVAFAYQYDIELISVQGGDHRLSIPGAPEKVVEEVLKFI